MTRGASVEHVRVLTYVKHTYIKMRVLIQNPKFTGRISSTVTICFGRNNYKIPSNK